jgi:hypothetical protein
MALGNFLQKRLSKRALAKGSKVDTPSVTHDDSTLSSENSTNSKISLLQCLAQKQNWKDFMALAEKTSTADWKNRDQSSSLSDHDDCSRSSEESTAQHDGKIVTSPLHIALAHRCPLAVVESVISAMKSHVLIPEETLDERGLTPLHVAAESFAEEDVIVRLLEGESLVMPAIVRDHTGRTPLHCAAGAVFSGKRRNKQMHEWHRYRAMQVLIENYPEAVHLTDDVDKTPVQYGKEQGVKNASMSRMHFLQKQQELPAAGSQGAEGEIPEEVSESCRCHDADEVKSLDLFFENE